MSQRKRRLHSRPSSRLNDGLKTENVGLSRRTIRLLNGQEWEKYDARFKGGMAVVTGLVSAGWSDAQIYAELTNEGRCQAAVILKDKYKGSLISQLKSKIGIARSEVDKHQTDIDAWFAQFVSICPRKRSSSLVRTAAALAVIARDSGDRSFTASTRQIAEVAGVGMATQKGADTKTVRKSLSKLSELGFISRRIRKGESEYEPKAMTEITLEDLNQLIYPTIPTGINRNSEVDKYAGYIVGNCSYREILHPLWEHSGLGFNAFRVWNVLRSRGNLTVREIATILGMPTSQVKSILVSRLEEYGLSAREGDAHWKSLARDFDDVAESLGVLERPDFRGRAFEIQRSNREVALSNLPRGKKKADPKLPSGVDGQTGEILE